MTDAETNPLLAPTPLPYGLPPYGSIRPEHYLPAFREAFARQRAEIDTITAQTGTPTFGDTLVALERSGELLDRVARTFYTVASADGTADIQAVEEELAPLMAAHRDAIQLNAALFARVTELHARIDADVPTALMVKDRPRPGHSRVTYYRHGFAGSRITPADVPSDVIAGNGG